MFKKIKFLDILLIFIIVILIGLVAHFSLIARNQFLQFIYPIEAIVSKKSIHCSRALLHKPSLGRLFSNIISK